MMTFTVLQNINPTLVTKLLGEMKDFKYKSWLPHFHPFFYLIVKEEYVSYARHYTPLLIRNRSWILTIHKTKGHST